MCLAVPAKIVERNDWMARIEVDGVGRQVSLMLLPQAQTGDFVLVHAGFAIQIIDEEEATCTLQLLKKFVGDVDEEHV